MLASTGMPFKVGGYGAQPDIPPTGGQGDSAVMDSLQLAVYMHNKQVDDSIRLDSLNRQKKNGIDAPVEYSANDSII